MLRLASEGAEKRLFAQKLIYVGISRGWAPGSRILFSKKSDAFVGYGDVARVQDFQDLDPTEKEVCIENNWNTKITFETVARFIPPVAIAVTPAASQNLLTLHGLELSSDAAGTIEELATCTVVM